MPLRESVFRQLTRYREGPSHRPRENRLTAALCVLLDRVDGLAEELVAVWLGADAVDPECAGERVDELGARLEGLSLRSADTQVPVGSGWADLRLRFVTGGDGRMTGPEFVVIVEAKLGTGPHGDQLRRYGEGVDAVVLLAPESQLPYEHSDEVPSWVPQRSWERLGRVVQGFRKPDRSDRTDQWLITEFLKLLREEGLMPVDVIGPEHLMAFDYRVEAKEALSSLLTYAKREIKRQGWDASGRENTSGAECDDYQMWKQYPIADRRWPDTTWLEFKVADRSELPDESGTGPVFLAGLSCEKRHELTHPGAGKDKRNQLLSDDFTTFTDSRCHRLVRVLAPTGVLAGRTLEEQGRSLGARVCEAFEAVVSE